MKRRRLLLAVLALCFALGGCGGQEADDAAGDAQPILLGFSQLGSESAWRIGNSASIERAARDAGITLMYANAEQKQEQQIQDIRSFIAYQVDVIAFSPIVEGGWDNVLREAKEAGIPVITTDRMISTSDESLYAGFVGSDFYQEGVRAGEYLVKKSGGTEPLNIVEISGTLDSTPMRQRASGFRAAIKDCAGLKIIDSISGDFLRTKGRERMKALLRAHDDIDVLYSHNDAMTLGAISAIEEAGLVPGEDIIIITVDGEQAAIDLLKQGKINCVVECTPMLGDTIMQLAQKLAAGEEIERYTYSKEGVFTEFDEDLEAIAPRGY